MTVTPYFTVEDADLFIAFVQRVFNGDLIKDDRYADGTVQHARLRIGEAVIMLNQSTADYPANVSQMHITVEDVEAVYGLALGAGGCSIMSPNTRPHGAYMAGIEDPCGNIWWIASAP